MDNMEEDELIEAVVGKVVDAEIKVAKVVAEAYHLSGQTHQNIVTHTRCVGTQTGFAINHAKDTNGTPPSKTRWEVPPTTSNDFPCAVGVGIIA